MQELEPHRSARDNLQLRRNGYAFELGGWVYKVEEGRAIRWGGSIFELSKEPIAKEKTTSISSAVRIVPVMGDAE